MKISIVCPYYNESSIIEKAVTEMLRILNTISDEWVLILVNDGSQDGSFQIVKKLTQAYPSVKHVSYDFNMGRGYALKKGIRVADGDIVITTEIDMSWGSDIIPEIIEKFKSEPKLDVVVASPNLKGGRYKNVPLKRVFLSKVGNWLIQSLFTKKITMNTGMTRGYRRDVIRNLPVYEQGKEFHLEVLFKLILLGYQVDEVPAVLEWKDKKFIAIGRKPRKSLTNLYRVVVSHFNFAVFANPIRYFWLISVFFGILSGLFLVFALSRTFLIKDAFWLGVLGLIMLTISLSSFAFGIISNQNNSILRELWRIQERQNREE